MASIGYSITFCSRIKFGKLDIDVRWKSTVLISVSLSVFEEKDEGNRIGSIDYISAAHHIFSTFTNILLQSPNHLAGLDWTKHALYLLLPNQLETPFFASLAFCSTVLSNLSIASLTD